MASLTKDGSLGISPELQRIAHERKWKVRQIHQNKELLSQIRLSTFGYLSEEHREATLAALKAGELFDKLFQQYPI